MEATLKKMKIVDRFQSGLNWIYTAHVAPRAYAPVKGIGHPITYIPEYPNYIVCNGNIRYMEVYGLYCPNLEGKKLTLLKQGDISHYNIIGIIETEETE